MSFLYFNYTKASIKKEKEQQLLYFIQTAAFKNYENVTNLSKTLKAYLVIEEEGLYHIYVAITADKNNLKILKEFYKNNNYNIFVKEKIISNKKFIKIIKNYDFLLSETTDKEVIYDINKTVLKKYEEITK
jgi:hypothetical protein